MSVGCEKVCVWLCAHVGVNGHKGICDDQYARVKLWACLNVWMCSHEQFWRPELCRTIVEPQIAGVVCSPFSSIQESKKKKKVSRRDKLPKEPKRMPSMNISFLSLSLFPKCLLREEDGSVLSHDHLLSALKTQHFPSGKKCILYAERLRKF